MKNFVLYIIMNDVDIIIIELIYYYVFILRHLFMYSLLGATGPAQDGRSYDNQQ